MNRKLDARGKGELIYDYAHDMLTFRIKERDYKLTFEFQNFAIDIDTENYITGVRIFDISKISGLDKLIFKNLIHGDFKASIKDNIISVQINFMGRLRNRIMPIFSSKREFTQQISAPISPRYSLADSEVSVPEIAI